MAKVNRTCEICSCTFQVKASVALAGFGRFCSRACRGIFDRADQDELTHEYLTSYLNYDSDSGVFSVRTPLRRSRKKIGDVVGSMRPDGYATVSVLSKNYKAHRLAWLYVYGVWPTGEIDHKDGNRSNNRIDNLRDVSHQHNMHNMRVPWVTNKSGFLGVTKIGEMYYPRLRINGMPTLLKPHTTGESAHKAYLEAKKIHYAGFVD